MFISREARVGIVAALAIFCLAFLVVFLRAIKVSVRGDKYYVLFADAGRVVAGTDVNLSGVRVGEVLSVKLNPANNMAQVEVVIDRAYKILKSYRFQVSKGTLIGQTAIEITPIGGTAGSVVHPNDLADPIYGVSMPTVESVIPQIHETLSTIKDTTSSLQKVLTDPTVFASVKASAVNIRTTTDAFKRAFADPRMAGLLRQSLSNVSRASGRAVTMAEALGRFADNMNAVVGQNRGELQGLFAELRQSAANVQAATMTLRTSVEEARLQESIDEALTSFRKTLANFQATSEKIDKMLGDPAMGNELKGLLTQAREASASLKAVTDSLKDIAADPQIKTDLKATVSEGRETVTTAKAAMENVKSASVELTEAMKSVRSAADRVNRIINVKPFKSSGTGVVPDMTFRHFGRSNETVTDLNLRIGGHRSFFTTGVTELGGDEVGFSLQRGFGMGKSGPALRLGAFRSEAGVGIDQNLGPVKLSFDVYDPNRPKYAGWAAISLTRKTDLIFGIERDRNRRELFGTGLRVRPF